MERATSESEDGKNGGGRQERGTLDLESGRLVNSFAMFANYSEELTFGPSAL
jgi:hypothetical protein